jgi:hypothetical protein
MIGSLRENWKHTWKAIWSRLDRSAASPDDLFARLYRVSRLYLADPPGLQQEIGILNDRSTAKVFFRSLTSNSFNGEQAIIAFLEDAYQDLASLGDGCAPFYKEKCRDFLATYNLPYCICDDFVIRLKLVGPIASLYEELRRVNAQDPHLEGLLNDFEKLFHIYCRDRDELYLRKCLDAFANYYDGLIRRTLSDPASKGKFAGLTKDLKTWPHGGVRSAINNLYGFCSDFPGIRHGGNPKGQMRQLREIDAAALGAFFLGFGGYLTDEIHESELIET